MAPPPLNQQSLDAILAFLESKSNCVFLETSKTDDDNFCSYIFHDPIEIITFNKNQSVTEFFRQIQSTIDNGFYVAGWFAYEFGYALEPVLHQYLETLSNRPLATLGIFPPPIIFNHHTGTFSETLPTTENSSEPPAPFIIDNVRPSITRDEYLKNLESIKYYIEAGDTYQVNYTLKLLFNFAGSATELYKTLRSNQPVSYSAFIKLAGVTALSFSPELFFRKNAATCVVKPMKGTISRGLTWEEDQQQIHCLQNDLKNRSENVMIVDLLRNDLGRLSEKGSVQMASMFDVETYATLHQMTSTITGTLPPHTPLAEIFRAFFPCGSVTGAPKIRTMEIINELETSARGIYTGSLGFIGPDTMTFNVPIRTLVLNGDQSEMGIGSGIVHDSEPEAEWQECLLKAKFLTSPSPDFQLIETLLWTPEGGFYLLDRHLDRLKKSTDYFAFPFDKKLITESLNKHRPASGNDAPRRIRLLLFRDGTIEVTSSECTQPPNLVFPPPAASAKVTLPYIVISGQQVVRQSPFLYHKTTNRQHYEHERAEALKDGCLEVIFENEHGEITEGSISSILIRKGGIYSTSPVKCGLLPGTFRAHLLEKYADLIQEKILFREDLLKADAIFIANSVRGITQVTMSKPFTAPAPG